MEKLTKPPTKQTDKLSRDLALLESSIKLTQVFKTPFRMLRSMSDDKDMEYELFEELGEILDYCIDKAEKLDRDELIAYGMDAHIDNCISDDATFMHQLEQFLENEYNPEAEPEHLYDTFEYRYIELALRINFTKDLIDSWPPNRNVIEVNFSNNQIFK